MLANGFTLFNRFDSFFIFWNKYSVTGVKWSKPIYLLPGFYNSLSRLGNQCEAHKCANGQDWCLVTYYRIKAINGAMEGKRERHECGSRNDRGESILRLKTCNNWQLRTEDGASYFLILSFILNVFQIETHNAKLCWQKIKITIVSFLGHARQRDLEVTPYIPSTRSPYLPFSPL